MNDASPVPLQHLAVLGRTERFSDASAGLDCLDVLARVIHVDRFADDRLVEHQGLSDRLGLLTQIGAMSR